MNKAKYTLILVILLLIPPIVNALLLIPSVCSIVGEGKDWISFWGSYSGALVTGIISFIILKKTIAANKQTTEDTIRANLKATELTIHANKQSILDQMNFSRGVDFRNTTSRCLSHLDVDRYTIIFLQLENGASNEYISNELMSCYSTIIEDLSSFELQYGKRFPQFTNEYHKLAKDVSFMVGAMAAYVYNVPEVGDSKRIDCNELSMFKAMADNIKEKNKEALDNLNKLAQELILPS